jgi:hypothetical protein
MFDEALESRLRAIEEEITRLLRLSVDASEPDRQDDYLRLAQDLQREARGLRAEINKQSETKPSTRRESRTRSSCLVLFA